MNRVLTAIVGLTICAPAMAQTPRVPVFDGVTITGTQPSTFPTPTAGDSSQKPATTAFVGTAVGVVGAAAAANATAIGAETTRATGVEATKAATTALTSETSRATAAEQAAQATANAAATPANVTAAVATETTRATGAEGVNTTAISNEVTRATGVEATKAATTALSNETTRATTAEGVNTTAIGNEATTARANEGSNVTAISNEVTRATGVESTKATTTALTAEATTARAAESAAQITANAALPASSPRVSNAINVRAAPYLAKGDSLSLTGAVMTNGSAAITLPSASFTVADIGKAIVVQGATAANLPLQSTIASVIDATHITLSQAAGRATPWVQTWSATVVSPGSSGYVPAAILTVVGGTGTAATFSVATTTVTSISVANPGSGGTNGTCTIAGNDGLGTQFRGTVTVTGGAISSPITLTTNGAYTTNPLSLTADPLGSTCNLTGATASITMGVGSVSSATPGDYSVGPANPVSTTGSGTGSTLSIAGYVAGGATTYGSDDTAAVTSAIAAGVAANLPVRFPKGGYWLASQTTSIPLLGTSLIGDEVVSPNASPLSGGSTVLISNQSTPVFSGMTDVTVSKMAFWWPMQDGSQTTPIVYPALFDGTQMVNDHFDNNRILNAYRVWHIAPGSGSGLGRVYVDSNQIYCIDRCFSFDNGFADILQLGPNNLWSIGAFGNQGTAANANLFRYSLANAAFFYFDPVGGGGAYTNADGLQMTGGFVFGFRYGIRLKSGLMDVSTITGVNWDEVSTLLSMEGTSSMTSTNFIAGDIYAVNPYDPNSTASVFNLSGLINATDLTVMGLNVSYAMGSVIADTTSSLRSLNFTSNKVQAFAQSKTAGFYYFFQQNGISAPSNVNITSNHISCVGRAGSTLAGVKSGGTTSLSVVANLFSGCDNSVRMDASTGTINNIVGNTAIGTLSVSPAIYSGTDTVYDLGNAWDKPPTREPISVSMHAVTKSALPGLASGVTDCGTSPSISGNDSTGRVTVGSGANGGKCTMTFAMQWKNAPHCDATDETTNIAVRAAPISPTTVSFSGALIAGDVVSFSCQGFQ